MIKFRKWIYLAILLVLFYYIFIVNIWITLSVIASLYIAFKLYKFYKAYELNKSLGSIELFRKSELGLFIALVAKVAKADGRVQELEAQLIGMMFDDISKVFSEPEKSRTMLKKVFNEAKERSDDTKETAASLNTLLGRSILKRRQFMEFLIQLAFIDNGVSPEEDRVLRVIMKELNISSQEYNAMVARFEGMLKNKKGSMSLAQACEVLGVKESDDMSVIKKTYRKLVREYHPDIIKSQNKDEAYIEEATAKTQEINQAYAIIKEAKS